MGEGYRIDPGTAQSGLAKSSKAGQDKLREENERLRNLVVTLASIALRNIAVQPDRIRSTAAEERAAPSFDAEASNTAKALETVGHELMAQAAAMKSALHCERRRRGFTRR